MVRWEAGKTAPAPWARPPLAQALQVSDEQLDDLLREAEGDDTAVDRRAFAGLATGLALAPLARARNGSRIGTTQLHQLRLRTARLRRLDDHLGGMDTYAVYISEMAATERLIKSASYSGETARALTGVLAEQAQMAGWSAFDAGRFTESRRHYRHALAAARESRDAGLEGNSLAFIAYEKADSATAEESTRVAGTRATPRVRALLHERLAWAHAVSGQALASERALEARRRDRPRARPGRRSRVDPPRRASAGCSPAPDAVRWYRGVRSVGASPQLVLSGALVEPPEVAR